MPRPITPEETAHVDELVARGREALKEFEGATQAEVDRLCQAVAWAVANETTFTRLALMGVEESGIGDPESRVGKRFKVIGILRDVLRQRSTCAVCWPGRAPRSI
jgi:sulfoacetaldehyde dehydrogenase